MSDISSYLRIRTEAELHSSEARWPAFPPPPRPGGPRW
jgi:hypothetical protein